MAKPGGGKPTPFNLSIQDDGTVVKTKWVDLGTIPSGQQYQVGYCDFTSIDKALTVQLRVSKDGESAATKAKTNLLGKTRVRSGKTKRIDVWKSGRLYFTTALSTGVEKWFLLVQSKKGTSGDFLYFVAYLELI